MSESASTSASESASTSASESASTSASESASESASTSASESASTSTSASESAYAAASTANQGSNNGNGSGNGSGSSSSATETAHVAPETTATNNFNELADAKVTVKTTKFNEVDVALENQEVSLAVVLDDEASKVDDVVEILEEETPLGMSKAGVGGRVWWYWILILISAISGKIAKDKRKSKVNEISE